MPLILMPMGRDQQVVAERVAARGAGIVVDARATKPDIAHAIQRLLSDPGYHQRAREPMSAIERTNNADLAVRELEGLGEQRRFATGPVINQARAAKTHDAGRMLEAASPGLSLWPPRAD